MRYNMASQTKGDLFFMEWQALLGVIAIIGIVVVVGGLIAFLGHVIIGAFDNEDRTTKQPKQEVMDYTQYKQQQALAEQTKQADYNFEAIDEAKAEKEKSLVEGNTEDDLYKLIEENDSDLDEIENRLKKENETTEEQTAQDSEIVVEKTVDEEPETTEVVETEQTEEVTEPTETETTEEKVEESEEKAEETEEPVDDLDIQNLIDEINNEVVDEEKEKVDNLEEEENPILAQYNIDDILNNTESEEETEEESEETEETATEDNQEQVAEQEEVSETEQAEETTEETSEETTETVEQTEEVKEDAEKDTANKELEDANKRIAELTAQLEELNKQLSEQPATTEVVTIDMTEDECLKRIAVLEERLKNAKKDYKTNMKEYRPLKKVMNDLDRYQTKLRRKEAIVAKKKVALYGVNNYVDIDKEKAEKLANELELLDGLRLSVNHCEEVINANKDRFPILEHTNNILEEQISQLEADLEEANTTLQKIRDRQGNGENNQ